MLQNASRLSSTFSQLAASSLSTSISTPQCFWGGRANSVSLKPKLPGDPVEFVLELRAAHLPSLGFLVQSLEHELPGSNGFPCCQPWVCVRWRVDKGIRICAWGLVRERA